MNKVDILEKLDKLPLKKEEYMVVGDTSLVLQDILEDVSYIELACSVSYYEKVDWEEKKENSKEKVKHFDVFEIGTNFYDLEKAEKVEGYQVMNLSNLLDIKRLENEKKNKKLIEKLDLALCLKDNYRYERELRKKGVHLIAGVDEVGRGPLVGPVVAACVILKEHYDLDGLTDSKKLSEKKREELYVKIKEQAISIGVGIISEKIIDEVNIYEATKLAMKEAINNCHIKPEHVLIDAMPLDIDIPTTSIIKGDLKSITISAASVIAKVTRDRMLVELDKKYPMYDFKNNKGYPTKKHLEAIDRYGILEEHRRSYGPVAEYIRKHSE